MKRISLIALIILGFSACKNKADKTTEKPNDSIETQLKEVSKDSSNTKVANNYIEINTWIDDFKNFRQAVYTKDKAKLKTYFNFPVDEENSSIWHLINLNETEWSKRKAKLSNTDLFYEDDFNKYTYKIFNEEFVKSIMKIKSAKLFKIHVSETPEFTGKDQSFKMIAEYHDDGPTTLHLNIAYSNNRTDENGEYVSEGEHNVIYIFDVIDHKKIIFNKIVVAG